MNSRVRSLLDRPRLKVLALTGTMIATIVLFIVPVSHAQPGATQKTIVDEWTTVQVPPPPPLKPVTVDPKVTALLMLDIQNYHCKPEGYPRCVASLPRIQALLKKARAKGMLVLYFLVRGGVVGDICKEVSPIEGERAINTEGIDKFYGSELEKILKDKGIGTVILVGTSSYGAVLHTATGASMRGLKVIVPVDGISADPDLYAEQSTAWQLVNAPVLRNQTTLTRIEMIEF